MTSAEAGRYMLFVMAGLAAVTAIIMQVGLKGGTPTGTERADRPAPHPPDRHPPGPG